MFQNAPDGYEEAIAEIDKISEQMRTSEGWKIERDTAAVDTTLRVFVGNGHELREAVGIVAEPGRWLPIVDLAAREEYGRYMDELDRLFHNYLASAFTLSSCLLVVMRRWWTDPVLSEEYKRRNPYYGPGLTAFGFWLRHATQHERIPVTTSQMHAVRDEGGRLVGEDYFALSRDELLDFDWSHGGPNTREARAYIDSLTEDPRLDRLIDAFTAALYDFASWFRRELRRTRAPDLKALRELSDRLTEVSNAMGWTDMVRPRPA